MKVTYRFVTGEVLEIEVNEELGSIISSMEQQAGNRDRAETRRHASLEALMEMGFPFTDDYNLADAVERFMLHEQLFLAIARQQPQQRQLMRWVFFEHRSHTEIARMEGVTPQAIDNRIARLLIRLKKILEGVGSDALRG